MRKNVMTVILILVSITSYSQNQTHDLSKNSNDKNKTESIVYKLFPTTNMWTFIKLNTRTGQLYQVQYHTEDDKRFETYLNSTFRVTPENELNGRFTLYSTQNSYNFILLDQIDGRMWQVQWSIDQDKRLVLPIY
jgi:hypothetical protein